MGVIFKFTRHHHSPRRHSHDGDGAGGELRRRDHDDDPTVVDDGFEASGYRAEELAIENKWLLRARTDLAQFGHFYHKYRGPLLSFTQRRVGDADAAEDLVSETFLEAVSGLWKFRFQGVTFGTWPTGWRAAGWRNTTSDESAAAR